MTTFLQQIVEMCCKIHFRSINPKKVKFHLTSKSKKFEGRRRLVGLWSIKRGVVTIQVDREFSEDADEIVLTAKIAHELAHVKLKHPEKKTFENEEAAEEEVKKFFKKWINR
jgi:hypothetical protein